MHEAQMHDRNSFLTLTYNPENLPSDGSLTVRDWQLFAKRMRRELGPFRFFQCGEYGETTFRPHHHAAIFGLDFIEDRTPYKTTDQGHKLYVSEILEALWTHGRVYIGELTFKSAAYIARYVMKKVTGPQAKQHYAGRKPEFITMSRRPGIGKTWLNQFSTDVYPSDQVIVNGKPARPPKYYDQQYEGSDPGAFKQIRSARVRAGAKQQSNNTPDRLAIREKCLEGKTQHQKRN